MKKLRIATRKSPLALWQAEFVQQALQKHNPALEITLIPMSTEGDEKLSTPLYNIGGKGLFLKTLETSLLDHRADIAVHSMKDMTTELPDGLTLGAFCQRDNPYDAFVSNQYDSVASLPKKAVVGTSSLRRIAQLTQFRPDLIIKSLRGNIGTRLHKLDTGKFDAIILAAAGLERLQLKGRIRQLLDDLTHFLPAIGQGTIGVECRQEDNQILDILAPINHADSTICITAERAFNHQLEGGCHLPIAGFATIEEQQLTLIVRIHSLDGKTQLAHQSSVPLSSSISVQLNEAKSLGVSVAQYMIKKGGRDLLKTHHA